MNRVIQCECGHKVAAKLENPRTESTCEKCGKSLPDSPPPSADSNGKPSKAVNGSGRSLRPFQFAAETGIFYWQNRQALVRRFATANDDELEVPVTKKPDEETGRVDNTSWSVRLPGVCVVCGESAKSGDIEESYVIDDLTQPLWYGLGGLVASIPLAWIVSPWLPPISIVTGMLFGYGKMKKANVTVFFRRCKKHVSRLDLPIPRLEGDVLRIRVGDHRIRELFDDAYYAAKKQEREDADANQDSVHS